MAQSPGSRPLLLTLAATYAKIGLLGFGGGYAVLSFIRSEVVGKARWLTDQQFDHIIEMSAFAPGATTTNVLAAIAYRLRGWSGLIIGTVAVLWPSFLLILLLAKATAVLHNVWLSGALTGIEISVVGLLIHVVVTLMHDVPIVWLTILLAGLAAGLTLLGVNPAVTVVVVAAMGGADFLIRRRPLGEVTHTPKHPE